jgi:RimJ/RimL family protein N-acetyltransferase
MDLRASAGWNQTEADWRNVLALGPNGCFGIEGDGELRATTTAVCFGRDLAWIGMVLTAPAYRGRGFARQLVEHAVDYLRMQQVYWTKLDATEMGRPLYERLGFRAEGGIERWMRKPGPWLRGDGTAGRFVPDAALDREAFGADRSHLLRVLAAIESSSIAGQGFAMGRPGSRAAYFGPCVARSPEAARALMAWFLERHSEEEIYWDILPANDNAIQVAREFGFERTRELVRMSMPGAGHPAPLKNTDALVFATAGFEYG